MSSSKSPWIQNNIRNNADEIATTQGVLYAFFNVFFTLFVLCHSWKINGSSYHKIRVIVDICCISTLIDNISIIIFMLHPTPAFGAIFYNLISIGLMGTIEMICDQYMTYSRYKILNRNLPFWKKAVIWIYLFVFTVLSWLPFYTILPAFIQLNDPRNVTIRTLLGYCVYFPAYALYDIVFTVYFSSVVWRIASALPSELPMANTLNKDVMTMVYKAFFHCVLSILANVINGVDGVNGTLTYKWINLGSLHFLFNWKGELYLNCSVCEGFQTEELETGRNEVNQVEGDEKDASDLSAASVVEVERRHAGDNHAHVLSYNSGSVQRSVATTVKSDQELRLELSGYMQTSSSVS